MEIQDILFSKSAPEFAKRGHSDNAGEAFNRLLERSSKSRGNDDAPRSERFAENDRPRRRDRAHVGNHHSHQPEHLRSDDRPTRQADESAHEKPSDSEVSDASEPKEQRVHAKDSRDNRHKESETPSGEAASAASCATGQADRQQCGGAQSGTEFAAAAMDAATVALPTDVNGVAGAAAGKEQANGSVPPTAQPGNTVAGSAPPTSSSATATALPGAPQNADATSKTGKAQTAAKSDGSTVSNAQGVNLAAGPGTGKAAEAAPIPAGQAPSTGPAPSEVAGQVVDPTAAKPAPQKGQSQTAPTASDHSVAKGATAKPDNGLIAQSNATVGNAQNSTPTSAQAPALTAGAAAASATGTPDTAPAGTAESDVSATAPTTSDGSNLVLTANRAGGTNTVHARPVQLHGVPINNIAVHIRRAMAGGHDHLRIRLHPADLGDVDVRMKIAHDGAVRVVVSVDRPETFDLMQRDARGLERALQDAGLKTDSGSLSFNLRDNGPGGFAGHEAAPHAEPSQSAPTERLPAIESTEQELVLQPGVSTRALDIRV